MVYDLNEDNFEIVATKAYKGKCWTKEELALDIKRIKYVKRLIGKYIRKHELNERLIINHIIILGNVFGPELTTKMLFLKMNSNYFSPLKTFLSYLNFLPSKIYYINGLCFDTDIIPIDNTILKRLREM